MDDDPNIPETPAAASTPLTDPAREAVVMATPPRDIIADATLLTEAGGGRVITPAQEAALAAPTPGATPAPQVNSRLFSAVSIAPNEFKITHNGVDIGGKTLTPTEVPVVLGWLNSLPPD